MGALKIDRDQSFDLPVHPARGAGLGQLQVMRPTLAGIDSDSVYWDLSDDMDARLLASSAGVIPSFSEIALDPSPERVLRFVKRYGPLAIAWDGFPISGSSSSVPTNRHSLLPRAQDHFLDGYWEPIAIYQLYASSLYTICALKQALDGATTRVDPYSVLRDAGMDVGPDDDSTSCSTLPFSAVRAWSERVENVARHEWRMIWTWLLSLLPTVIAQSVAGAALSSVAKQRHQLALIANDHWIQRSGLQPRLDWSGEYPRVVLDVGADDTDWRWNIDDVLGNRSTFRAIAVQLSARLLDYDARVPASKRHEARCDICGSSFTTSRLPRIDRTIHCGRAECKTENDRRRKARSRGNLAAVTE